MSSEVTAYSASDTAALVGGFAPTARELQTLGVIGLDMERADRALLMNRIGGILGMPAGGWHGQAKLFEGGDIRLRWLRDRAAGRAHRGESRASGALRSRRARVGGGQRGAGVRSILDGDRD